MAAGTDVLEKRSGPRRLSQMLVLTGGEVSDEPLCLQMADLMHQKKLHLTLMGVGLDWKASLIKDMAKRSDGKWYYIDVNDKRESERIFVEEFEDDIYADSHWTQTELHLRPMKDVKISRLWDLGFDSDRHNGRCIIQELPLTNEPEERHIVVNIGVVEIGRPVSFLLEVYCPSARMANISLRKQRLPTTLGSGDVSRVDYFLWKLVMTLTRGMVRSIRRSKRPSS